MFLEVAVKALIVNKDGEYLILKRSAPYPGEDEPRWDAPGGRINAGETLNDALFREIKEETGMVMVGLPTILGAQDILRVKSKHTVRLTYSVKAKGSVKLDQREHTEYRWLPITGLKKLHCDLYLESILQAYKDI